MKRRNLSLLLAMLLSVGAAGAQLKPSGTDSQPLPPTTSGAKKSDAQAAKETAAAAAAEDWLRLLDAGQYGKAWDQCATLFKERVKRADWVKNLPATRDAFGAVKERKREIASYSTSLPGAPDGEYVTVRFATEFDKKQDAQELTTLRYENGSWRPTGYFIR